MEPGPSPRAAVSARVALARSSDAAGGSGSRSKEARSVAGLNILHRLWNSRGTNVGLVRTLAILSALTILGIGLFIIWLGVSLVMVCPGLGGCRPEPVWPLVALGIGLALTGPFSLFIVSRKKTRAA